MKTILSHFNRLIPAECPVSSALIQVNDVSTRLIRDFKSAMVSVARQMAVDGWPVASIPKAMVEAVAQYRPTLSLLIVSPPAGSPAGTHIEINVGAVILPPAIYREMIMLDSPKVLLVEGSHIVTPLLISLGPAMAEVEKSLETTRDFVVPEAPSANMRSGLRILNKALGKAATSDEAIMLACGLYLEGMLPMADLIGEPPGVAPVAPVSSPEIPDEEVDD